MPSKRAPRQAGTSTRRSSSRTPEHAELLRGLGREIRALRVERGQTQEGFAKRAGVGLSYYGTIERGKHDITYEMLLRIAAALEVPASAIVRRVDVRYRANHVRAMRSST